MKKFQYKAFISYSHHDRLWAEWLMKALESFSVPKSLVGKETHKGLIPRKLYPLFRDRDELPAAERMTDRLFEAIRNSEFLIVLCSPQAAQSNLVNREIVEFKRSHGNKNILSMIVDGTPFSDDPKEECFPEALLHSFHADGAKAGLSAEGLAADVRPNGDGKSMGLLKIIAGMLGVGLNDLVRRQERRRNKQIAIGASVATIAIALMGWLAFSAAKAERKALDAQITAENRSRELELAHRQGENLVTFLSSTVYPELEKSKNIGTLKAISERILRFYDHDPAPSDIEEVLRFRTVALFRLGQALERMGDTSTAEQVFTSALNLTRSAYTARPDDPVVVHRHQVALFFSGYLDQRLGRLDQALDKYQERLQMTQKGAEIDPEGLAWIADVRANRTWQEQIAESQASLGYLLVTAFDRPEEGFALLETSYKVRKRLFDTRQDKSRRALRLGSTLSHLGRALLETGQFDAAREVVEERQRLYQAQLEHQPKNRTLLRYMNDVVRELADVAAANAELEKAYTLIRKAATGFALLSNDDPENILLLYKVGEIRYKWAQVTHSLGDHSEAAGALEIALQLLDEVVASDASRPNRRLTHYNALLLQGRLQMESGDEQAGVETIKALKAKVASESDELLRIASWKSLIDNLSKVNGR